MQVHVALAPAPGQDPARPARERVAAQSMGARACLEELARRIGAPRGRFDKDDKGAPLPMEGWHWSLSHDGERVAAALARVPVGVDLERIALRRAELAERVLSPGERALLGGAVDALAFTRTWTAKEAVLKAAGVGLAELGRCRLLSAGDAAGLYVAHRGAPRRVLLRRIGEHLVAVHAAAARFEVDWLELPQADCDGKPQ